MATYSLKDADKFLKDLSRGMEAAAMRGLMSAAQRTVAHIQNELIPATVPQPVARGMYRAGWRAEKTSNGALVINDVPHANFIENGVRGDRVKIGRAMITALAEWARMKGIGGRMVTSKSGRTRLVKATEAEATSIAWAIAKSMQAKGIFKGGAGLGVFKRAAEQIPRFIREEVAAEIKRSAGKGA